jgi:hypothetical protein
MIYKDEQQEHQLVTNGFVQLGLDGTTIGCNASPVRISGRRNAVDQ